MNEHDYALRDAAMAEFVDSYFKARPQLLRTRHEECLVEAGFKAAWKPDQTERAEKAEAELARLLAAPNEIGLGKGEFVIWPVKINGVHGLAFVKTDDPKVVGTPHAEPEDGQIELGAGDSAIYFGNAESAMVLAERLQYVISLMTGSDAAPAVAAQVPQSCWLIERNAAGWPPIWLTLTTFERKYVTSGNHHYTESAQCALKFHDKESADEYIRHYQIKHVTATEHIFDARALLQEVKP